MSTPIIAESLMLSRVIHVSLLTWNQKGHKLLFAVFMLRDIFQKQLVFTNYVTLMRSQHSAINNLLDSLFNYYSCLDQLAAITAVIIVYYECKWRLNHYFPCQQPSNLTTVHRIHFCGLPQRAHKKYWLHNITSCDQVKFTKCFYPTHHIKILHASLWVSQCDSM